MIRKTLTAPKGADRWERAALNRGFGADRSWVTKHDGSWWWTNGHAMLRCDGEMPTDLEEKPELRTPVIERRAVQWGPVVVTVHDEDPDDLHREAVEICVWASPTYLGLVEESIPGCTWMAGEWRDPIHALDADGRLMAIVMGVMPS